MTIDQIMHALDSTEYKTLEITRLSTDEYFAEIFTKNGHLITGENKKTYKDSLLSLLEKIK